MSVKSLENVRSEKGLLILQQDEREQVLMNAVSFPASVLRGDSSTGEISSTQPSILQLILFLITTT